MSRLTSPEDVEIDSNPRARLRPSPFAVLIPGIQNNRIPVNTRIKRTSEQNEMHEAEPDLGRIVLQDQLMLACWNFYIQKTARFWLDFDGLAVEQCLPSRVPGLSHREPDRPPGRRPECGPCRGLAFAVSRVRARLNSPRACRFATRSRRGRPARRARTSLREGGKRRRSRALPTRAAARRAAITPPHVISPRLDSAERAVRRAAQPCQIRGQLDRVVITHVAKAEPHEGIGGQVFTHTQDPAIGRQLLAEPGDHRRLERVNARQQSPD